MIVRDEEAVIARCLRSVRDHITHWLIVDTGSQDKTIEIVSESLREIPGHLVSLPWRGFPNSRNDALCLAREFADYVLFIDADDVLIVTRSARELRTLTRDYYWFFAYQGAIRHRRIALVSSSLDCSWTGETHEFLSGLDSEGVRGGALNTISLNYAHDGARSRSETTPHNDIARMQEELKATGSARLMFYLALTYLSVPDFKNAKKYFLKRTRTQEGDEEEIWYSTYQLARLKEQEEPLNDEAIRASYIEAIQLRPERAEPYVDLARYLRQTGHCNDALNLLQYARALKLPEDGVLVDIAAYGWKLLDEYATTAANLDQLLVAHGTLVRALKIQHIPAADKVRMIENKLAIKRAMKKLSLYANALN
jgi:Glycosyl transferase family 2